MIDKTKRARKRPPQRPKQPMFPHDKEKLTIRWRKIPRRNAVSGSTPARRFTAAVKVPGTSRVPPSKGLSSRESYREVIKNPSV